MIRRWFLILDEPVDDVILQRVHDHREKEHDKEDLHPFIALRPTQRPIPDGHDPGTELEDDEDAELHTEEAEEVDEALTEPPGCFGVG